MAKKIRAHALLSASGAKRWMACTPSAVLEEAFPDKETSYSVEGTAAHALAEKMLKNPEYEMSEAEKELWPEVKLYVEYVEKTLQDYLAVDKSAVLFIEHKLDFSEYVEEGFGTGDAVILVGNTVHVIDLKFGKGVPVSAFNNPQLRLYGLGAYLAFADIYDIEKVVMTIHQPRLDSVSSDEVSVTELLEWAEKEVRPKAQLAYEGQGEFVTGDHCQFCKAAATCRKRAEEAFKLARMEFKHPDLLSPAELGEVLTLSDKLKGWIEKVRSYALEEALQGRQIEGYKVVEGRANRVYTDKECVAAKLISKGYDEALIYKPKDLIGITEMTKLLGKKGFDELLGSLVVKPQGSPTLVPISDKRPEWNSAAKDFIDIEIEG